MNKFFARLLCKLRLVRYFNINIRLKLNKEIFIIPIIKGIGYDNLNISEKWLINILEILIREYNGTFVDVGANTGQTLLKLRSVSSSYHRYF